MRNAKRGRWVARCAVALGLGVVVLGGAPLAPAFTLAASGLHLTDLQPTYAGSVYGDNGGSSEPISTPAEWGWT
jgi:hypothetical protein